MEIAPVTVESGGRQIAFDCFDTANFITLYGADDADALLYEMRDICMRFDDLWNFSKPNSDIARINAAEFEAPVDASTAALLQAAKEFNAIEPAFDLTVGAVSHLWKHAAQVPSAERIARALKDVGMDLLTLGGGVVAKASEGVCVDVGAIAKGYIADELARFVRGCGVSSADIDLGGNLYLVGQHPASRPWRLEEELPAEFTFAAPRYLIEDASVSTSSNFLRAVTIDGKEYGHIISPLTGMPAKTDIATVSVIAQSSLTADMLSTVFLSGGSAQFEQVAARHDGVAVVAVTFDERVLTAGFPCEFAYFVG